MAAAPPRRVIDDHAAHYWFMAVRLLEMVATPLPAGARHARARLALARMVLSPMDREAITAAKTPVGRVGFANAVVVALELLEVHPLPAHPYSWHVGEAVKKEIEQRGETGETLRISLLDFARAQRATRGYVWRWAR